MLELPVHYGVLICKIGKIRRNEKTHYPGAQENTKNQGNTDEKAIQFAAAT